MTIIEGLLWILFTEVVGVWSPWLLPLIGWLAP